MIDLRALEKNQTDPESGRGYFDEYQRSLRDRGADLTQLDRLLELNKERKAVINQAESKKAEQNRVGQIIATKKRGGEDATEELSAMQALAQGGKELEQRAGELSEQLTNLLLQLPNKLHHTVPAGKSAADNVVYRQVGAPRALNFKPKEHWQLGEELGLLDFERAAKVTGARFAFLKAGLARLERALMNFMLDLHTSEHGYVEMWSPFIVNDKSLLGTGQLPKFGQDLFKLEGLNYYLIPTAEVPLTNYYQGEILQEADLPQRFVGFTPCFRAEAGSYGRDTKGLIRQHQFDKVELMQFVHPSTSYERHEKLLQQAEEVLKRLELPYQVVTLCSGDISAAAAKCFDINVWLPGQNAFREISSCSNFEDYQARRGEIRFRPKGGGKTQYVHTLNGSGLAIGRTAIAIMENGQNADGTVTLPKALLPYMGGMTQLAAFTQG